MSEPTTDPYRVLGVEPDAPDDEVHQAYLRLARRFHPDLQPHGGVDPGPGVDGGERMRELNAAWAVIGDPMRRATHDAGVVRERRSDGDDHGFIPFEADEDSIWPTGYEDLSEASEPPSTRRRLATLVPVGLFATSIAVFCLAMVLDAVGLLAASIALWILSCVGFLVVPLLTMVRAAADE